MEKSLDNNYAIRDREHYEDISSKIRAINDKYLESITNGKGKKKKKKDKISDMEKIILEKNFETESLPEEYFEVTYREKMGRSPDENEKKKIFADMRSKGYIFSENGQPYEPKIDPSKTEKENFEMLRKEWEKIKKNIENYMASSVP